MIFVTRKQQNTRLVGYSMVSLPESQPDITSDAFFDGNSIGTKSLPRFWIEENDVHRAPYLGNDINSNRYFLGPQSLLVRDEIRSVTYILVPEPERLFLVAWRDGVTESKTLVVGAPTVRAHVVLDKYTGTPMVLSVHRLEGVNRIFWNGKPLATSEERPDFPFAGISQVPVGMVATNPAPYGLLSYKSRTSNKIYLRRLSGETVEDEVALNLEISTAGGADFAIYENSVLLRVNAVLEGKIVPYLFASSDAGRSFSPGKPALEDDFPLKKIVPSNAATIVDKAGQFHVPILAQTDGYQHLIDLKPEHEATEALVTLDKGPGYEALSPFPSTGGSGTGVAAAKGDGVLDGAGVIASILSGSDLLASNSQSGGYSYPHEALLNHDMPGFYAFKPTDCYVRGVTPNTVSMDYVYIEANDYGLPIWNKLFIETWDMPLPEPQLSARVEGNAVRVEIVKCGFFLPGKTTFAFDNPTLEILEVRFDSDRKATVICRGNIARGTTISFNTKTPVFFHAGAILIT